MLRTQRPQSCRSVQSRVIRAFRRRFGLGMRIAELHLSVTAFRPGTF
jgi:hypothetical protein